MNRLSPAERMTAGALALFLLAAPSYSQTVPIGDGVSLLPAKVPTTAADDAIRPFHLHVSKEVLADMRRRVLATRRPDRETVAESSLNRLERQRLMAAERKLKDDQEEHLRAVLILRDVVRDAGQSPVGAEGGGAGTELFAEVEPSSRAGGRHPARGC